MTLPNPVLAQKLGLSKAAAPHQDAAPASPMRQMRRALGRAADKAMGLSASVLGIAEEDLDAEALIDAGPDGWIVLGLRDGSSAGLTGLFLIDPPLRSALVDMQTMGCLLPPAEDQRAVTRTDAVLSVPFAAALLHELDEAGFGASDFDPAGYDLGPMEDLRTAGLVLVQGVYRMWRITVQLGGDDAQGEVLIAMRPKVAAVPDTGDANLNWSTALHAAVADAPADLDAVLTRMMLPIDAVDGFAVGQLLPLAGTTVGSVTLIGPGGRAVSTARLGQVAGKRAVRLQEPRVDMQEDPPHMPAPKTVAAEAAIAPQIEPDLKEVMSSAD